MKKRLMMALLTAGMICAAGTMTIWADETVSVPDETVAADVADQASDAKETHAAAESQQAVSDGKWMEDGSQWQYQLQDGTLVKNRWKEIDGYWYYFDRDGYMADDWTKINGIEYCFRETGDLVIGWCFNEESEKWYYYDKDGTPKTGWFQDKDGSWYWFTSKGEMVSGCYKALRNVRYYFLSNGQMAANQYVGLSYMDENGQHDKKYDIVIEGKMKESDLTTEVKDQITEAMKDVPREWIKNMVDHGWQILYYPDREYFSAPNSGGSRYYIYHKLDSSYRKIKICKPEALSQVLGEYIGYASDCYNSSSQISTDLSMNRGEVESYISVPDYYANDMQFYFGRLVEAYLNKDIRSQMQEDSPAICQILNRILYGDSEETTEADEALAADGAADQSQ